jgi:cytochrome c
MRLKTILAASIAVMIMTPEIAGAQPRISMWDGVYTDAQAERGHTLYMQNCSRCHGADLSGTYETPPLVGRFMPYWSGSTLDALFDYVSTAMPLDHPGALSAGANADILAFILKSNEIPSGSKELSAGSLKPINFDSAKPTPRRARK